MTQITASLVKELRDRTGAGMMDCKNALSESSGDIENAAEWLRKKGLAAAAKKAGRVAAEGLVAVHTDAKSGAIAEVNSETDFVARNETFQAFVAEVAKLALASNGDLAALNDASFPETERTVAEEVTYQISTIGENMALRRVGALSVDQGVVASYVHNAVAPGMGKIAVLVALESSGDAEAIGQLGKQLAMHVAAANPQAATIEELDQAAVDKERRILAEQAKDSGKPEEIIAKMVEGRLRKFYQDVVLFEQTYVIDGESTVAKVIETAAKETDATIELKGFLRYELGEGIDKGEDDFAAEVAQLTS